MADRQYIAGLPLFVADVAALPEKFESGTSFWKAVDKLTPGDRLAGQLDHLLGGASSPRVWLLLHEPGQPQLSAVAALMLARALNARGQNVLVLDADEAGAALTIWSEREETEGWIDVARFGASVLAAGVDLPFRGARGLLLGVGSFVPTDVTADEIVSLLGRLRHQADDILVVAAVGPAALPWARRADRRLFCWDRSARGEAQLGPVFGPFAAEGVPLTGLVAYGEAAAAMPAAAPPSPEPPLADPIRVKPAVAEPVEDTVKADSPEPVRVAPVLPPVSQPVLPPTSPPVSQPASPPVSPRTSPPVTLPPMPVEALRPEVDLGAELEPPRGTPRMFWAAAAVFGLALVAISWYWTTHIRVPPGGYFEPVVTREEPQPTARDTVTSPGTVGGSMPDSLAAAGSAEPARRVAEAGGLASIGDTLPASRTPAAPVEPKVSAPDSPAAGRPAPFDRAPYSVPAGQAGWALHVYSLADSASAAAQVAELERSGLRTAVRIVEIREKGGRWWRVYVGSFPTRSAANAALPALLDRLKATWAEPARIQDSTP